MNRAGVSASGSIAAAFASAASWFCCLPLAAGALGAGTSAFAATIGRFRIYFDLLAIGLLGFAFYQVYRSTDDCDECSPSSRRRQRLFVWLVAIVTAILISTPWWSSRLIYFFIT